MHYISTILYILLLSPSSLSQEQTHPQLRFMSQLFQSIKKVQDVSTIYSLRHHGANNCVTDDWKPRDMPIIRSTEMTTFEMRINNNRFHTVAVICINQDSDVGLLNNLAISYNHMRQERIILWMQTKASKEMLQDICILAEVHKFAQMLVLDTVSSGNVSVKGLRLRPFPRPFFVPIDDVINFDGMFREHNFNFQGKEAIILPMKEHILEYNISYGPKRTFPINTAEDRQIVEFSLKKNLSLKIYQGKSLRPGHFDLFLTPQLVSTKEIKESANPFTVVSVIVVVPCGKERSIQDVFKQLNSEDWLLYILPVYVTFVVVEWLMHFIIYRATGRAHRLNFLNPLVNLRAFAAIVGLSFPVPRRWSFSLHQLFLVLSIFGFVFSNFFACKLSALLTKHSRYAQVQNLEQLRLSGLPIVIDKGLHDYLKRDIDSNFLTTVLPNTVIFDIWQRYRLLVSLNDSFGYIMFKNSFIVLDNYQKSLGRKVLCDARNLTLISNLPKMFHLPANSLYRLPLQRFIHQIYDSGINLHWNVDKVERICKALNFTVQSVVKQSAVPLSLQHFNWLWPLLIFGYGLSTLVFLFELLLAGVQNWRGSI